jgi:hypothetical protein
MGARTVSTKSGPIVRQEGRGGTNMKKFIGLFVFAVVLGAVSIAFADVNPVTPSTNDLNKGKTPTMWAHVNQLNMGPGTTDLQFVSMRTFWSCFEYRTDGDTSQVIDEEHFLEFYGVVDESEGLQQYPYDCLYEEGSSLTKIISANEYVEVRMIFGAEGDERFDWTRFDVLLPTYSCVGFDPPLDTEAIQVRNNKRVLPFKAMLIDGEGNPVTDISPPMLDCNTGINGASGNAEPIADLLPPGKSTDGNQFELTGDSWHFNMKLWNNGPGTYRCDMIPGNGYNIEPMCTVDVEIQD